MDLSTAFGRLMAAREMVGVNHAAQTLKGNRDNLRRFREGLLVGSDGASLGGGSSSGEEMMVLGDVHQTITNAAPEAPKKSTLGTLAKLGVAGALLASGAGAGLAIPLILDALKPAPGVVQPVPTPSVDTDSDTSSEIILWPPKGKQ